MIIECSFPTELPISCETGPDELQKCMDTLKLVSWFMFCSDSNLREIASKMTKETFREGDSIVKQGAPHTKMIIVSEGSVERLRLGSN